MNKLKAVMKWMTNVQWSKPKNPFVATVLHIVVFMSVILAAILFAGLSSHLAILTSVAYAVFLSVVSVGVRLYGNKVGKYNLTSLLAILLCIMFLVVVFFAVSMLFVKFGWNPERAWSISRVALKVEMCIAYFILAGLLMLACLGWKKHLT